MLKVVELEDCPFISLYERLILILSDKKLALLKNDCASQKLNVKIAFVFNNLFTRTAQFLLVPPICVFPVIVHLIYKGKTPQP